ncbi:MAG TPA: hypothetical protein VKF81_07665 [Blastocatellia bacterium]|nr:hypothetical protein [Blastocatellia bacterium]
MALLILNTGLMMRRSLIVSLSIGLAVAAATPYFVFGFDGCPLDNNRALAQYNDNKPVISNQFVDGNQNAIAKALVPLWLNRFTSRDADPGIRLKGYDIHNINVAQWAGDQFLALVTFSVKPEKCSYEEWLTGNGEESQDWVRNKCLFFTIVKRDDRYIVESVGSSP